MASRFEEEDNFQFVLVSIRRPGDDQIREQATLGGNLVNASPAADATPPMLAMNAELTLHRKVNGNIKNRKLSLNKLCLF